MSCHAMPCHAVLTDTTPRKKKKKTEDFFSPFTSLLLHTAAIFLVSKNDLAIDVCTPNLQQDPLAPQEFHPCFTCLMLCKQRVWFHHPHSHFGYGYNLSSATEDPMRHMQGQETVSSHQTLCDSESVHHHHINILSPFSRYQILGCRSRKYFVSNPHWGFGFLWHH